MCPSKLNERNEKMEGMNKNNKSHQIFFILGDGPPFFFVKL
jgi:hypothetical protein